MTQMNADKRYVADPKEIKSFDVYFEFYSYLRSNLRHPADLKLS